MKEMDCQNILHKTIWNRSGLILKHIQELNLEGPTLVQWNLQSLRRYNSLESQFRKLGRSIKRTYVTYLFVWILLFTPLTVAFFLKQWKIAPFSSLWIYDPTWPIGGGRSLLTSKKGPSASQLTADVNDGQPISASGVSQHSLIQTWPPPLATEQDGDDQLDRFKLLQHLRVVQLATTIEVEVHDTKWTLRDICYRPNIPKMSYLSQKLADHLTPCSIVTPLDCFWEGAKIHKQTINQLPLPDGQSIDLSFESLYPGDLIRKIQSSSIHVNLDQLNEFMNKAGLDGGYVKKPCLNWKDPKCPAKQNSTLNLEPILATGCTGMYEKVMRWPKDLIIDHESPTDQKLGGTQKIRALQTTIQLMSEEDLFHYWESTSKISSLAYNQWTGQTAREILTGWQAEFQALASDPALQGTSLGTLSNLDLYKLLQGSDAFGRENRIQAFTDILGKTRIYPMAENTFYLETGALRWPLRRMATMIIACIVYLTVLVWLTLRSLPDSLMYALIGVFVNSTTLLASLGIVNLIRFKVNLLHSEVMPFFLFAQGLENIIFMASKLPYLKASSKNGTIYTENFTSLWLTLCGPSMVIMFLTKLIGLSCISLIPVKAIRSIGCSGVLLLMVNQISVLLLLPATLWAYYHHKTKRNKSVGKSVKNSYPDIVQPLYDAAKTRCQKTFDNSLSFSDLDLCLFPDPSSNQNPKSVYCCSQWNQQTFMALLLSPDGATAFRNVDLARENKSARDRNTLEPRLKLTPLSISILLVATTLALIVSCNLIVPLTTVPKLRSGPLEIPSQEPFMKGKAPLALDLSLFYPTQSRCYATHFVRAKHFDAQQIYSFISDDLSSPAVSYPYRQKDLYALCNSLSQLPQVIAYREPRGANSSSEGLGGGRGCGDSTFWLSNFRNWLQDLQNAYSRDLQHGRIVLNDRLEAIVHVNASNKAILGHALLHQTYRLFGNRHELYPFQHGRQEGLTYLVDKDGIINPQGFYYYLTAWASNDPLFYYESQANLRPSPQKWIFDPYELEFNVPKSKKLTSTTMPLFVRGLNLRSLGALHKTAAMLKFLQDPAGLWKESEEGNVAPSSTLIGTPFSLLRHFDRFTTWIFAVCAIYLFLYFITATLCLGSSYITHTASLTIVLGALNLASTLALGSARDFNSLLQSLTNAPHDLNDSPAHYETSFGHGLNYYQLLCALLWTVLMSSLYTNMFQMYPTLVGNKLTRLNTLYGIVVPYTLSVMGGYAICVICMHFSSFELIPKLVTKSFIINSAVTTITITMICPLILNFLPGKPMVTLKDQSSHLTLDQPHAQEAIETINPDQLNTESNVNFKDYAHCPSMKSLGQQQQPMVYYHHGAHSCPHGLLQNHQQQQRDHQAMCRDILPVATHPKINSRRHSGTHKKYYGHDKRGHAFIQSDNSLSTISEESPSLITTSEDSISQDPLTLLNATDITAGDSESAQRKMEVPIELNQIGFNNYRDKDQQLILSSQHSITTITAKATIVIKNV